MKRYRVRPLSEGRDMAIIKQITDEIESVDGVKLPRRIRARRRTSAATSRAARRGGGRRANSASEIIDKAQTPRRTSAYVGANRCLSVYSYCQCNDGWLYQLQKIRCACRRIKYSGLFMARRRHPERKKSSLCARENTWRHCGKIKLLIKTGFRKRGI